MKLCMLLVVLCYIFVCVLAFYQNDILLGTLYIICALLNTLVYYLMHREESENNGNKEN